MVGSAVVHYCVTVIRQQRFNSSYSVGILPHAGLAKGGRRGTSYPGTRGSLLGPGRMKLRTLNFSVIKPKITSVQARAAELL